MCTPMCDVHLLLLHIHTHLLMLTTSCTYMHTYLAARYLDLAPVYIHVVIAY